MNFSELSDRQRAMVARKIGGAALTLAGRAHFGAGYEPVKYPFSAQRRASVVELTGEDGVLSANGRHRIANMHRDMMRNSPTRVSQDQQIRVNVVGTTGGKLFAKFPEGFETAAGEVMYFINRVWAPHCEFTFSRGFNWVLKTALTSMDANGDIVLLFDDGFLTGGNGTGKVRAFEGDEIANLDAGEFAAKWKGYTQSHGFIYDRFGRFCGLFASTRQRGRDTLNTKDGVIVLQRDPDAFEPAENWVLIGEQRRFNQGRAVSPLTAAINCLVDLHEVVASETQAAKVNAQLVGQILQGAASDSASDVPQVFEEEAPDADALPETVTFRTAELNAIGAHFDQMPPDMKIELLDTKRPNPNMSGYIEFLTGLAGGARGLARVYSTLKAQTSYTAYRGEQVMTQPTFEELQKTLEREVCDPLVRLAVRWGVKTGMISAALPDGWENMLSFAWPRMREVNELDALNALEKKIALGLTSIERECEPGQAEAIAKENAQWAAKFAGMGIAYPGTQTVSGQSVGKTEDAEQEGSEDE